MCEYVENNVVIHKILNFIIFKKKIVFCSHFNNKRKEK